jgi:hypothetical protein
MAYEGYLLKIGDYIVPSEEGKYIIQIFDITNAHHWLTIDFFRVVNE